MNFTHHRSPSNRTVRVVLLAGVVLTLSLSAACGKKGPLYLPDDASTSRKTGEQTTGPASLQPSK